MPAAVESAAIVAGVVVGAVLVVTVLHRILHHLGRRSELAGSLLRRVYWPAALMAALVAARLTIPAATANGWHTPVLHMVLLAIIATGGWLLAVALRTLENLALRRFRLDVRDNLAARRVHTQITVIRRVAVAVVVILVVGSMLMTFPQARAAGASVLASAGLVSIIAALAAQSMLGNIFAGLQLAFGNAVRLDDVVVVEGEWGRIEEMTLGYVVVKIWDERRLILPSSYFTTTPFQHWTRTSSSVLGTIEVDVDWSMPVEEMRGELRRIVEGSDLWDERVCSLQVTGATGGAIRIRALVSAADSGSLWDLRCLVRERLVDWVRQRQSGSLPRIRAEVGPGSVGRLDQRGPDAAVEHEVIADHEVVADSSGR